MKKLLLSGLFSLLSTFSGAAKANSMELASTKQVQFPDGQTYTCLYNKAGNTIGIDPSGDISYGSNRIYKLKDTGTSDCTAAYSEDSQTYLSAFEQKNYRGREIIKNTGKGKGLCLKFNDGKIEYAISCNVIYYAMDFSGMEIVINPGDNQSPGSGQPARGSSPMLEVGNITDNTIYADSRLHLQVIPGKKTISQAKVIITESGTGKTQVASLNTSDTTLVDIQPGFTHYHYLTFKLRVKYVDGSVEEFEYNDGHAFQYANHSSTYSEGSASIIAPWNPVSMIGYSYILVDMLTEDVYACTGQKQTLMHYDLSDLSFGDRTLSCVSIVMSFAGSRTGKYGELYDKGETIYELIEYGTLSEEEWRELIAPE